MCTSFEIVGRLSVDCGLWAVDCVFGLCLWTVDCGLCLWTVDCVCGPLDQSRAMQGPPTLRSLDACLLTAAGIDVLLEMLVPLLGSEVGLPYAQHPEFLLLLLLLPLLESYHYYYDHYWI